VRADLNEMIERLCALDDPARRAAYLAVRSADRPLTRAQVATAVGISARLAAFHLEKLCSEGLVEATYERDGESAGVGHPAKRYRPTRTELEVSVPPRRYDLAAEILAAAFEQAPDSTQDKLLDVATEYGRAIGSTTSTSNGGRRLITALELLGYEPTVTSVDDVVLRNCPFRLVAEAQKEVICAMNLALVIGVLAGTESPHHAVLSPSTERCCVMIGR
jgi:predicted ArsR family transcriptional regulator